MIGRALVLRHSDVPHFSNTISIFPVWLIGCAGIDLFETPEAHKNICSHPRNRVHQALQRGEDSWVFVLNIMVPGTPYLCFVCYFLGDKVMF